MDRFKIILGLLLLASQAAVGQITITHPIESAVYQRSNNNKADVIISGTFDDEVVTSIQARLLDRDNGNAVVSGFDWTIIDQNPGMGYYQGKLTDVPAGWYKLEVRARKSGTSGSTTSLTKFGVGDVYAIAGQSNAMGWHDNGVWNGTNGNSEKVVAVGIDSTMNCSNIPLIFPVFTPILETTKLVVNGNSSWIWGALGDKLVTDNGIPVSFFNYAAAGTTSLNWRQTAEGNSTYHVDGGGNLYCSQPWENGGRPYGDNEPYNNFKRGLQLYNSMFGARTVLWHQGEYDNYPSKGIQTSKQDYKDNLNTVISKSRQHFNSNLPWMIARVSYFEWQTRSEVIDAQTEVANQTTYAFKGPNTDDINNNNPSYPGSRDYDNVHFLPGVGFNTVSDRWKDYITGNDFKNSVVPITANEPPEVSLEVLSSGDIKMSAPSGYSSYKWINVDGGNKNYEGTFEASSSRSFTVSPGSKYMVWVENSNGALQVSAPVRSDKVYSLGVNTGACASNAYLSDMKYASAQNNRGPVEIDKTSGGSGDGDGETIKLKSITYNKGIGVHGQSEINYILDGNTDFVRFKAKIGIHDNAPTGCANTGVYFEVKADGNSIYTSGLVTKSSSLKSIDVDITGKRLLTLITTQNNDSNCNQAVWADAELVCGLDTEPPTVPTNFAVSDTLTTCVTFSWDASTDNLGVTGYDLYLDGNIVTTVSGSTLSYRFSGLDSETEYTFGVRAKDAAGNNSSITTHKFTTPDLYISYGDYQICVSTTYFPSELSVSGGVFSLESGPAATVNSTTGAFYSDVTDAYFYVKYEIGTGISGCTESTIVSVGTTTPPSPPVISSNVTLANSGTVATLSVNSGNECQTGTTLKWNFTDSTLNPVNTTLTNTQTYYAECWKELCAAKSNEIEIVVLDDCYTDINLINPDNIISGHTNLIKYNASNKITAANLISPAAKVEYNAKKSITFEPGFTVEPGVTFKAEIKNCP